MAPLDHSIVDDGVVALIPFVLEWHKIGVGVCFSLSWTWIKSLEENTHTHPPLKLLSVLVVSAHPFALARVFFKIASETTWFVRKL